MVDEEGRKEDKFEFDSTGQSSGYISMAQARVLAMQTAREEPGNYGAAFEGMEMFFEVEGEEEDEDYYHVRVSFRPVDNLTDTPGIEEFILDKNGDIALRQIVSRLDSQVRRTPQKRVTHRTPDSPCVVPRFFQRARDPTDRRRRRGAKRVHPTRTAPPLMLRISPVMCRPSREHKNTMGPATSSAVAMRPIGMDSAMRWRSSPS